MTATTDRARIDYAPGEAWCIAAGRVVLVCERDLTPQRALELHARAGAVEAVEALRELVGTEPTALIALLDLDAERALLRRHGVPAAADGAPLPDRFGPDWSLDQTPGEQMIEAGGLGALDDAALPLEGGVVRVAAVRVAPRAADASAHDDETAPPAAGEPGAATGAFGQTLPPAVAADARATSDVPAEHVEPAQPEPEAASEPEAAPEPEPEAAPAAAPEPEAVPEPAAAPEPAPEAEPTATPEPHGVPTDTGNPIGGLIDSVPGFIKPAADVRDLEAEAGRQPAPGAQAPAAAAEPVAATSAPAPTSPPAPTPTSTPVPAPAAGTALGDHDGMTVTAERARELLAEREGAAAEQPPATGPLVLSTICPTGHVNAPGTRQCFQCGAAIDEGSTAQRRRPEVAVAALPSGERVPLGRGVIIGRRPRSRRVEDGRVPRLVTVESPGEDISRSHVELRVEDWNLVAIDLSSTNGTLLLREGSAPQRLRPEASTILQLGDRLDLGDDVIVTIEAAP